MTLTQKIVISLGSAAAIGILAAMAVPLTNGAYAEGAPIAAAGFFGGYHKAHWRGHRGSRVCNPARTERLEHAIDYVREELELNERQQPAFDDLAGALRAASGMIGEACEEVQANGLPDSAPRRLAKMETWLDQGLGVLRDLRPRFDAFYETLSPEQRKKVDDAMGGHHRHH